MAGAYSLHCLLNAITVYCISFEALLLLKVLPAQHTTQTPWGRLLQMRQRLRTMSIRL